MDKTHTHDVIIIGGGISGTALLYLLAKYTDINDVMLMEKYNVIANVNSHGRNNSQTLHCGDIETNYTLDKALQVQASANMVVRYAEGINNKEDILYKYSKMVIGVGDKEVNQLRERFTQFSPHYPGMQLLERDQIEKVEPAVISGREEEIVALAVLNEYTAVNFQALSESFVTSAQEHAKAVTGKNIEVKLNTKVSNIKKSSNGYKVKTAKGTHYAKFVVVSSGGHSLLFAHRMGYGLEFSCLPMAGSFYYTPDILKGKVYTVQNDKLPFAAIHGDPDVLVPGKTRFGPTALALPVLERYNWKTLPEFLYILKLDINVIKTLWGLLRVSQIRNYLFKNMCFELPIIRRHLFLGDARKIVPNMQLKDLTFAKKTGGIRPVMIDKKTHSLHLGEAKLSPGNGLIFNMTPSPGATSCLGNAEKDMDIIANYLGANIDKDKLNKDLR
ncbi:MAG: FAD-dependent oxidoreductase [Gammaproteobacteria bacterium]|nr:FAD-dependent oxidoreductase [Gammaproteobacteria bacterium]